MPATANRPSQSDQEWVKDSKGNRVRNIAYKPGQKKSKSAGVDKLRPNMTVRPEPDQEASPEELLSQMRAEATEATAARRARLSAFTERLRSDPKLEGYTIDYELREKELKEGGVPAGYVSSGIVHIHGDYGQSMSIHEGDVWRGGFDRDPAMGVKRAHDESGNSWKLVAAGGRSHSEARVRVNVDEDAEGGGSRYAVEGYDSGLGETPRVEFQTTSYGVLGQDDFAKYANNVATAAKFHPVAQHAVNEYWTHVRQDL